SRETRRPLRRSPGIPRRPFPGPRFRPGQGRPPPRRLIVRTHGLPAHPGKHLNRCTTIRISALFQHPVPKGDMMSNRRCSNLSCPRVRNLLAFAIVALALQAVSLAEPIPLKRAVELAVAHSTGTATAQADVDHAQASYREARNNYIPQ